MSGAVPLLGGHRRDRSGLALVALALCAVALIAASASWAQVAAPDRLAVAMCEQAFEAPRRPAPAQHDLAASRVLHSSMTTCNHPP